MKRFVEARKSTSGSHSSHSSTFHHTTYVNGSHGGQVPLKTALIITGVVVAIIMAILILYCIVHHHEYKKGTAYPSYDRPYQLNF